MEVSDYFRILRPETAEYFEGLWQRSPKAWTLGYTIAVHAGVGESYYDLPGKRLERSGVTMKSTRVKSAIVLSLTVDATGAIDCPVIFGRFRPVRMVSKRGAIPHQSAPCAVRQIGP
jgi:hypothetical protein